MKLRILVGLLLCNLLWSGAYVVSKALMHTYKPLEVTVLRHLFALIPLSIYLLIGPKRQRWSGWLQKFQWKKDYRIFLLGFLTFFISPLLQMTGLNKSRAVDGALMIAIEPVATILLAVFFLREKLRPLHMISLILAVIGAAIVSEVTFEKLQSFKDARLIGNSLIVLSMFCEAAYSILAKPILNTRKPVHVFTISLLTGISLLFIFNLCTGDFYRVSGIVPLLTQGTLLHWCGFIFLGVGCSLFAYLYWMCALKEAPVSLMAMTLYIQPVLGLLWANLFLGERIAPETLVGAALILVSITLSNKS